MATGIHYWPHLLEMSEEQCKGKLRCMELEAYSCIVAVLRARGPLTDEKHNFMKLCAKEFHISQERHKVEIRRASNNELLSTIAEMLYGPNTETKWFIEGRRLAPLLNTEPRQSIYIEFANRMSEIARAHNASLPPYSEYKDEPVEVENMHLKEEEEALIRELEAQVKAQEAELKKIQPLPLRVNKTDTIMECHEIMPLEPQVTQTVEVMEEDQVEEIKGNDSSYVVVDKVEEINQDIEIEKSPVSRKKEESDQGKLSLGPGTLKSPLGAVQGRDNIPPARKKKRSLSIEMYDGSSAPPKRFSNVPPPRIPATPVSQRPPRFQSSQPSRIMVVPGSIQQPHSIMTHINTGSTLRKTMVKSPAPPIISKIQRPRMYSTPIKSLYTPSESGGGNKPPSTSPATTSISPSTMANTNSNHVASARLGNSSLLPSPRTTLPTSGKNLILVQKSNSASKSTVSTTMTTPGRITLTTPNRKDPNKLMLNKTQSTSTNVAGAKSVLVKSAGSSSQNNVILVDITQDQISGNISVEELLKASGLSNQPTTMSNTMGTKTTTTPLPNIIKLQNPKSLGSLPANIQQIKIIKSSGSKFVLTTSAGCSMETVLSIAQSSASASPIFTPSSSTGPRMICSLPPPRPNVQPGRPVSSTVTTPTGTKISIPSPITTPKVVPSSLALSLSASAKTPFGSLTPRSTPSFTSVKAAAPRAGSGVPLSRAPLPRSMEVRAPNTTAVQSNTGSSSGNISTGSHLADWLSNYVVSDKDIEEEEEESDSNLLFEDVSDKM